MKNDHYKYVLFAVLISGSILLSGCNQPDKTEGSDSHVQQQSENRDVVQMVNNRSGNEYPEEIEQWINRLRSLNQTPLWHSKILGDSLYVYIGWGEKPTGGYSISITEKKAEGDEIVITAEFRSPEPGAMVTQALTYPYAVGVIEASNKSITIRATGNSAPRYIQTVKGIDKIPELKAVSERIVLFEPAPDTHVKPDFEVKGLASVFEGTVNYRILTPDEQVLTEGFTTAVDGMNWAYFSFKPELKFPEGPGDNRRIVLNLFAVDAKDGREISAIEVSLVLSSP